MLRVGLLLVLAAGLRIAAAGSGALDPTFGTDGRTFTNIGVGALTGVTSVAIQADGRLVVVANQFVVSRYNGDGTLDAAFNGSGRVLLAQGSAFAAAIQGDGKIVVAGAGAGFVATRLNGDGTRDTAFGSNGSVTLVVGNGGSPYDVRIQPDGRIVMAGLTFTPNGKMAFALARLNPDGSPDATFNGQGTLVTSIGTESDVAYALAIQPDGKIVVAGHTAVRSNLERAFVVLRLMPDGARDPSFGIAGVTTTSFPAPGGGGFLARAELGSLALQGDGSILASGFVDHLAAYDVRSLVVARYTTNGSLDPTFNGSGIAVTPFRLATDYYYGTPTALAAQPDGKIVLAATDASPGTKHCALARYLPDGSLDASFNGGGTRLEAATLPCDLRAAALQADGRVVSGGLSNGKLVLFRHLAGGAPDATFGSGGYVRSQATFTEDVARAVALGPEGRIVTLGDFSGLGSPHTLTRHTAGGVLDASFGSEGVAFHRYTNTMTARAVAIDSSGRILTAGSYYTPCAGHTCIGPTTLVVGRVNPDGTLDTTFGSSGWASGQGLEYNAVANGLAIQPDGRIVAAGSTDASQIFSFKPAKFAVVRFLPGGAPDASFGGGRVVTALGGDDRANAVALHADGRIVAVGGSRSGTHTDLALVRYTSAGVVESVGRWDMGAGTDDSGKAVAVQGDGMIVVGGSTGAQGFLARFSSPGAYDAAFADGGKRIVIGAIVALALQPDGKIVALTEGLDLLRFLPSGASDPTFGQNGRLAVSLGARAAGAALAIQPDGRIVVAGTGDIGAGRDFALARIDPSLPPALAAAPEQLDFGGQSMHTTSPGLAVTVTNGTGSVITIQSLTASAGYAVLAHDCASLAAMASCTATVAFTPAAEGALPGSLAITGDKGSVSVPLQGIGERSLVTHYYRSILRRAPDAGGKAFWLGEASRVTGLGAGVNEVWFAMAMQFYFSPEYAAQNRSNAGFVADLYGTFFNRVPDPGGLAFWLGRLDQGMPREVALAEFMFSAEFRAFTQAIFGAPNVRAEVNMVTDFYRGLLARLPDNGGFNFWLSRFRSAQCQGAATVQSEVESISSLFVLGGEYSSRNRSIAQFVGDLYNAFLRRGGDLEGVQYWINEIATGARSRDQVRMAFASSPEFQARVSQIIQQGCLAP